MKPSPASKQQAKSLQGHLQNRGWVKGKNIALNNRVIRNIVTTYPHKFISGQFGYKLVSECSVEELTRGANDHRSRAMVLLKKAKIWDESANEKLHPYKFVNPV
tara:strand:+ start:877 stop:1188 length:312 start_codon:yes stop_codon:yes gene_type:complete